MPAVGLSSLERYLPLRPWGGLAEGRRGDWARQTFHCVLGIPSPTGAGSSSSPQLGDENPDLTSTMMNPPYPRSPDSKAGGRGQPLMRSAWAVLGNPWGQRPQQGGA